MTHDELLSVLDDDAPPARVEVVHFAKPELPRPAAQVDERPQSLRPVGHATCEKCGSPWRGGAGPHSPRWQTRNGRHVQVDCVGDVVAVPPGQ